MKLPVVEMSSPEEGPHHEEVPNGVVEEVSINGGEESSSGNNNANPGGNNQEKDENPFADYLWMENEEDFDQEVMRQLEEDIMISHYSDMFENSLLEDGAPGPTTASLCVMNGPILPPFPDPSASPDELDEVTRHFNRSMGFASRLNPNAAEFVPRTFSNGSSPH